MSESYVGEIRMFAGTFAPAGWAFCDGRLLAISAYDVLFNLIGTTYGGDGQSTFALPDLQSRFPAHAGTVGGATYVIGGIGGAEEVTLTVNQLPAHSHPPLASSSLGTTASPSNAVWAASPDAPFTTSVAGTPRVAMSPYALAPSGGGGAHENRPPYLAVNFIISLFGVFPSAA
jgi:microcystin-dependent protein